MANRVFSTIAFIFVIAIGGALAMLEYDSGSQSVNAGPEFSPEEPPENPLASTPVLLLIVTGVFVLSVASLLVRAYA